MGDHGESNGEGRVTEFRGYPAPTSNTTYTPNQFFDVVLRHSSRGTVRLVAYMMRKTLGWSDAHGNPREPQVVVSYRELIEEAGISRGAVQPSVEEAIASRYIRCIRPGRPSGAGESAVSALYELRWDEGGEYTTDPEAFQGFFAGNGNLTYIPNPFFDYTVSHEPLAVVKVVGTIIRHTIGFQTKFGFRRQHVAMSFTDLQRTAGIGSRRALNEALQYALRHNHLDRVEAGVFDPAAGQGSKAATYGIKWSDSAAYPLTGSKRIPEISEARTPERARPVQKGYRENRFKKDTGTGSKGIPEPVQKGYRERSKKDTGIEITSLNNTPKQQQTAAAESVFQSIEALQSAGFDAETASALAHAHAPEIVARQIAWLPQRRATRNRLGLLRKSIVENWPAPEGEADASPGAVFAKHFYAAWAGNEDRPAAAVTAGDVADGARFVEELLRAYPDEKKVPQMARSFGRFVREKEAGNSAMPRSLRLALVRHADAFVVDFRRKIAGSRKKAREDSRKAHFARHRDAYVSYLRNRAEELRLERPELFAAFEEQERRQRDTLLGSRLFKSTELSARIASAFDNEAERLNRLYEFLDSNERGLVPDFWTWDRTLNPKGFSPEATRT